MAKNGTIARVSELPDCDFCKELATTHTRRSETVEVKKAHYDFRTQRGYWANGCSDHWLQHRMYHELGLGMGQKLVAHPDAMEVSSP